MTKKQLNNISSYRRKT